MFRTIALALFLFIVTWTIALLPFWIYKLTLTILKKNTSTAERWFVKTYTLWVFFVLAMGLYALNINGVAFWMVIEDWFVPLAILRNFDANLFPDLVSVSITLVATAAFVLSCTSLGVRIVAFFAHVEDFDYGPLMYMNVSFLIGASVNATILMFFSIAGIFSEALILRISAISLLSGIIPLAKLLKQALGSIVAILARVKEQSFILQVIIALSCVTLALTILQAWGQLNFDASAGYFANAKLTALQEAMSYVNVRYTVVTSFHSEILYSSLYKVFNEHTARLLTWFFSISLIISILSLSGRILRIKGQIFLLAMMMTTTAFTDLIGDGKIDLHGAALVAVALALMPRFTQNNRVTVLFGLFCGWAVLSKPTYFPLLTVITAIGLWQYYRAAPKRVFRRIIWLCIAGAVVLSTHLLRNWLLLGDLTGLSYLQHGPDIPATWNYGNDFALLVRASFPIFSTHLPIMVSMGVLSQLWLLTLPLVFYLISLKQGYKIPFMLKGIIFVVIAWVTFTPSVIEHRYILAFTFAGYVICALALENDRTPPVVQYLLLVASVILLAYAPFRAIATPILAPATPEPFSVPNCEDSVECMVIRTINNRMPINGRVLPLMQYPSYLRDDLLKCVPDEDEWSALLNAQKNQPEQFWETLYRHGFDMIGTDKYYTEFSRQLNHIELENIPEWLTVETLYYGVREERYFAVYQLSTNNPPSGLERQSCENLESFIPVYREGSVQ